ncbi:MAG: DivIVA domain-containing protein [Actinobacteria bacterium]|nr:DivIVA domain-containing protein [Actinomycetota bacterium]
MSLTPQDIQRDFKERFRGYDPDEVDEHLSRLADRVVSLQDERDRMVEQIRELERSGGSGGNNGTLESERLLKRTLIAAEQTADRVVSEAESEAERVVSDARRRADELLASARSAADREWREARDGADRVRRAVAHLRAFRDDYTERVRSAIAEQLAVLDRVGDLPEIPSSVERLGTLSVEEPQRLPADTGGGDSARRARQSASSGSSGSTSEDEGAPRRSAWNAKPGSESTDARNGSWSPRPDGVWSTQNGRQNRDSSNDDMAARRAAASSGRPHNEGENRDSA